MACIHNCIGHTSRGKQEAEALEVPEDSIAAWHVSPSLRILCYHKTHKCLVGFSAIKRVMHVFSQLQSHPRAKRPLRSLSACPTLEADCTQRTHPRLGDLEGMVQNDSRQRKQDNWYLCYPLQGIYQPRVYTDWLTLDSRAINSVVSSRLSFEL